MVKIKIHEQQVLFTWRTLFICVFIVKQYEHIIIVIIIITNVYFKLFILCT